MHCSPGSVAAVQVQAAGLPDDRVGRIQQMISQLETATEKLAQQRAAAEAQLGQQEVADEAAVCCIPDAALLFPHM